jgi:hypothetical protein
MNICQILNIDTMWDGHQSQLNIVSSTIAALYMALSVGQSVGVNESSKNVKRSNSSCNNCVEGY